MSIATSFSDCCQPRTSNSYLAIEYRRVVWHHNQFLAHMSVLEYPAKAAVTQSGANPGHESSGFAASCCMEMMDCFWENLATLLLLLHNILGMFEESGL
jgi:hypothetical protein